MPRAKARLHRLLPLCAVAALLLAASRAPDEPSDVAIANLRCEYEVDPIGLDTVAPRFSWQLRSDARDVRQSAYQVRVATTPDALEADETLVWDSNKNFSNGSIQIVYGGPPLAASQRYFWKVRVWDSKRRLTRWSEPASFEIGPLTPEHWEARWIEPARADARSDSGPLGSALLRRSFRLDGELASARLRATSRGVHALVLNGQRVGTAELEPGWSAQRDLRRVRSYDVAQLLAPGENVIGAELADGWWPEDGLALFLQLELRYADGRLERVTTDEHWRAANGPVLASAPFGGESYDARLARPGWGRAGYDAADWSAVRIAEDTGGRLAARHAPPLRRITERAPVSLGRTPSGDPLLDFGRVLVGRVRVSLQGAPGTTVTLRHATQLGPGGNLRAETGEDLVTTRHVLAGGAAEVLEPRFSIQRFRYVAVEGAPTLRLEDASAQLFHSDLQRTGEFDSSSETLNRLHAEAVEALRTSLVGLPLSSAQVGSAAEALAFAPAASFDFDTTAFYAEWLRDVAAQQRPDGGIPMVVPEPNAQRRDSPPLPGWGNAIPGLAWELFQRSDDSRQLEEHFDALVRWIEFTDGRLAGRSRAACRGAARGLLRCLRSQERREGVWNAGPEFGDRFAPVAARPDLVATAYHARSVDAASRIARIIGRDWHWRKFEARVRQTREAFQREFLLQDGRLVDASQTATALALAFDLLPRSERAAAARHLAETVARDGHVLTSGVLGTPHVLDALTRFGHVDDAYAILLRNGGSLHRAAPASRAWWRRLTGGRSADARQRAAQAALERAGLAAGAAWLYRVVAGIEVHPEVSAYQLIRIAPQPGGALTHARGRLDSPYGTVETQWRISGDHFELTLSIPTNARAEVRLPRTTLRAVQESGSSLADAVGIGASKQAGDDVAVEVGSGRYVFRYPWRGAPTRASRARSGE